MRLWDLESGSEVRRYTTAEPGVAAVDFSPDGRRILVGEGLMDPTGRLDHTYPSAAVYLWSTEDGRLIARSQPAPGFISSVAFGADGKTAISGGYSRSAKVWAVGE